MNLAVIDAGDSLSWGPSIAQGLGCSYQSVEIAYFPSGEISIPKSLRSTIHTGIFVCSLFPHPQEQLAKFLVIVDHVKPLVQKLMVVIPFLPYTRQSEKSPLQSIGKIFHALGVDSVVTIEPHTPQVDCFFHCPVHALRPQFPNLESLFPNFSPLDTVVISPDQGGCERAQYWANQWALPWGFCIKERIGSLCYVRDVSTDILGKSVLLVDDIVDTGHTLCQAAEFLKKRGAQAIRALGVHSIFSKGALERLQNHLAQLIMCDTVPMVPVGVECFSLSPQVAEYIASVIIRENQSTPYLSQSLSREAPSDTRESPLTYHL